MKRISSVAVYLAAAVPDNDVYASAAKELAQFLAKNGISAVYGASECGLMKVFSDEFIACGGCLTGVFPENMTCENSPEKLSAIVFTRDLAERKRIMLKKADAVIALPGAYGTLDEFFEALALRRLGMSGKPCGLLNVNGFYDDLLRFIDRMVKEGFLSEKNRRLLHASPSIGELFSMLSNEE